MQPLPVTSVESGMKSNTVQAHLNPKPRTLPTRPTYKTWVRRLNTKEDKFSLHKISGIAFMLSSSVVLATGAFSAFETVPMWLQYADAGILLSSTFQMLTSIDMAIHHRRRQPLARDQMISMACVCMLCATVAPTYTPFAPSVLCDKFVSDTIAITLNGASSLFSLSGLSSTSSDEGDSKQTTPSAMDTFLLVMSSYVPLMANIVFMCFVLDPSHDHEWLMQFASDRGGAGHFYYTIVFLNACVMYSGLLVTLQDKKLVPQETARIVNAGLLAATWTASFHMMF